MSLSAVAHGPDITIDRAALEGRALRVELAGSQKNQVLDATATVALSDLSRWMPGLAGDVTVQGHVHGPTDGFALDARAQGEIAPRGKSKGPFSATLRAEGLPNSPSGRIEAEGRLAESPLRLATSLSRDGGGAMHILIEQARWKSAQARGELTLPTGAAIPVGTIDLRMGRLEDLEPFVGQAVTGSLTASVNTVQAQGKPQSNIRIEGQGLGLDGNSIDRLSIGGRIEDPAGRPSINLQVGATGINAFGVAGSVTLDANGPTESLALRLTSNLQTPKGPAQIMSTATARASKRQLQLNTLRADYGGETARLLAPAVLDFGKGLSIDRLRVGIRQAVLSATGRISPTLGLTASVRNLDLGLAEVFVPDVPAQGTVTADAKLRGAPSAPEGSLRIAGRGLRLRGGSAGAMPAADLDGTAEIGGELVRLDARIAAGNSMRLRLFGAVPRSEAQSFDLNAEGTLDFALLDPLLTPQGRSARGIVALTAKVAGPPSAPRASGSARLSNGSIQDFAQGVRLSDIAGLVEFAGDTVRIRQLTGKAGPGTVSIAGTVAPLAPGMPVEISVSARNARLLTSDLLSANTDANLTIKGDAGGELTLAGQVQIARADINIPDRLPQSVAVLDVRRPGQEPVTPTAPKGPKIGLNLVVDAPEQIFVRGHGVDAELGGKLEARGTTAEPQIGGGFDLRRGVYSLAGRTLDFTSGKVTFDGAGLSGKLNPALNFVARSTDGGITATLTVTGHADSPKIQLSSSPELPQDEILAHLLFGRSVKQLSPLELAQIAQAIASLTGVGGGGDVLANVRKSLGLDRLSAGGAAGDANAAAVEAGKYVARGVYVGTKQGTSGGMHAKVQIDLTKHLKLESTVGTGGGVPATGATPDNDPGSSVGLSYQIEY
jgi:translocation and assembly module TamB